VVPGTGDEPGLVAATTWLHLAELAVILPPGFTWLNWPSFFLGLVETFAYGWYVALVFGPLYNFFAARFG
jgi:hypothetical protein